MINLETPNKLRANQFATTIVGWYAGDIPANLIKIRSGSFEHICRLEKRPDVEAAYPGRKCTGFRSYLDFLSIPESPVVIQDQVQFAIDVDGREILTAQIPAARTWIEDVQRMRTATSKENPSLGIELRSGDSHYRAYVGLPEEYDLSAASPFHLLVLAGLRQHHRLVDVGCGSLRCGRLLIPYLNRGNYSGIEPNRWLVDEGITNELGAGIMAVKNPSFSFTESPDVLDSMPCSNFALANSIFSHASLPQIDHWLKKLSGNLCKSGALVATYVEGDHDYDGIDWVYPGCIPYRQSTMQALAAKHGFRFQKLDWMHLHGQTWTVFAKESYDLDQLQKRPLTWNAMMSEFRR